MRPFFMTVLAGAFGIAMSATAWAAAESTDDNDLRDLAVGQRADAMPRNYYDFACGRNGGPPAQSIKGWTDFMKCAPDAQGLREVYFTFDDELHGLPVPIPMSISPGSAASAGRSSPDFR